MPTDKEYSIVKVMICLIILDIGTMLNNVEWYSIFQKRIF